jgi:hypothetical protein
LDPLFTRPHTTIFPQQHFLHKGVAVRKFCPEQVGGYIREVPAWSAQRTDGAFSVLGDRFRGLGCLITLPPAVTAWNLVAWALRLRAHCRPFAGDATALWARSPTGCGRARPPFLSALRLWAPCLFFHTVVFIVPTLGSAPTIEWSVLG